MKNRLGRDKFRNYRIVDMQLGHVTCDVTACVGSRTAGLMRPVCAGWHAGVENSTLL